MPHITTRDGTSLYVKVWGEGRPVVLMHGWPLSADSWDDQALALSEAGHKVIAYDRRGFGRSDQPGKGYEYDTLSDDLAEVMKECSATDAALVGFSMGGGEVARYLSRHNGKKIKHVALVSSIVPYMLQTDNNPHGVPSSTFDQMTEGMLEDRAEFFTGFFNDFYGMGMIAAPVSDEVLQWSRNTAMQAGLNATLACAKAFATTDFRNELSAFTMPTLIIHGTADKTVPIDTSARPAAKAIKQSDLVEYDGAAHGLLATHKNEISRLLVKFLK